MTFALLALVFAIGVIAGLRSMTAPAVVSWAVRLGWIHLNGSRLANMGTGLAVIVLTVLAIGELITDKLRFAPYRTAPGPLIARLVTGAVCAAALAGVGWRLDTAGSGAGRIRSAYRSLWRLQRAAPTGARHRSSRFFGGARRGYSSHCWRAPDRAAVALKPDPNRLSTDRVSRRWQNAGAAARFTLSSVGYARR